MQSSGQRMHAQTFSFLRGQSALVYSFLLQLQLLTVLSLPDLPDVPHDGGIAAEILGILLAGHLRTDTDFLCAQTEIKERIVSDMKNNVSYQTVMVFSMC